MSETTDKKLPSAPNAPAPEGQPTPTAFFSPEDKAEIAKQAKDAVIPEKRVCTDEERIQCALKNGPYAIDNAILTSVSDNINKMAEKIDSSEEQKSLVRAEYVDFFKWLLTILLSFCGVLIVADTFYGIHVRTEFLISAVVAVIADVFAIVHTLVHYMTNVEHNMAYNQMIDSLLKHIDRGPHNVDGPSGRE